MLVVYDTILYLYTINGEDEKSKNFSMTNFLLLYEITTPKNTIVYTFYIHRLHLYYLHYLYLHYLHLLTLTYTYITYTYIIYTVSL
mgnify:CR=1 FL=1